MLATLSHNNKEKRCDNDQVESAGLYFKRYIYHTLAITIFLYFN